MKQILITGGMAFLFILFWVFGNVVGEQRQQKLYQQRTYQYFGEGDEGTEVWNYLSTGDSSLLNFEDPIQINDSTYIIKGRYHN